MVNDEKRSLANSSVERDAKLISEEWDAFIRRGSRPAHVAPPVLRSWERSRELGVDPFGGGRSELLLSHAELERQVASNQRLLTTARPYMYRINDAVRGQRHLIYLTEVSGNILELLGDEADKAAFKHQYNFCVGASWNECAVGTTAVSVALFEDTTISYMSSAKYCFNLKLTSCAAIPLHDDDEELVGILGIATDSRELNANIFWMLISAQMGIENRFRLSRYEADIQVIHDRFRALYESTSDVIVCVDAAGQITSINSAAEELLNLESSRVRGRKVEQVLDFSPMLFDLPADDVRSELPCGGFLRDSRKRVYPLRHQVSSGEGISAERLYIFGHHHGTPAASPSREAVAAPPPRSSFSPATSPILSFDEIVGEAPAFAAMKEQALVAAGCDANVLICGESGTGKELFAQAIHFGGARARGPFVAINCGSIPRELVESELFGYAPGAFTGADRRGRAGRFEQAHGGTLFLDEIGEMAPDLQVNLLRVLQDRQVTRIGATHQVSVDVRVIAATNKEMLTEVARGRFRNDLFWRLNVIDLSLPPLSQRRADIPHLIDHFLRKHGRGLTFEVDHEAQTLLCEYTWPGNVRELENALQRAVVFSPKGTIHVDALPAHIRALSSTAAPASTTVKGRASDDVEAPREGSSERGARSLEQSERLRIEEVLRQNDFNISRSARILGIARNTLYNKIKRHELDCPFRQLRRRK